MTSPPKQLTPERARELYDAFFEKRRPRSAVEELVDIYERHFVAEVANWDFDREVLVGLLDAEVLDHGTVALIFWRSSPTFFQSYAEEEVPDYQRELYEIMTKARARMEASRWSSEEIVYNPVKDGRLEAAPSGAKWSIPQTWFRPTPGRKIRSARALL